jgi:hypothetical protein
MYGPRVLGWKEVEATSFLNAQQETLAAYLGQLGPI